MHKQYRALWKTAGYRGKMGSAEVTKPPPPQFKRLYHITSSDHAISDITRSRLKVARFADLNDPFELMAISLKEKNDRSIVKIFKDAYGAQSGLLCFSDDWTNPVLWSHYGAKHYGVCLGFDVMRTSVEEVLYEDNRLIYKALNDKDADPTKISKALQNKLIRTKYSHWKYEQEWRRIVALGGLPSEDGLYFQPFNKNLNLVEIILGPLCPEPLEDVRKRATKSYPNISIIKSRLAYKWFKIVPEESTVI